MADEKDRNNLKSPQNNTANNAGNLFGSLNKAGATGTTGASGTPTNPFGARPGQLKTGSTGPSNSSFDPFKRSTNITQQSRPTGTTQSGSNNPFAPRSSGAGMGSQQSQFGAFRPTGTTGGATRPTTPTGTTPGGLGSAGAGRPSSIPTFSPRPNPFATRSTGTTQGVTPTGQQPQTPQQPTTPTGTQTPGGFGGRPNPFAPGAKFNEGQPGQSGFGGMPTGTQSTSGFGTTRPSSIPTFSPRPNPFVTRQGGLQPQQPDLTQQGQVPPTVQPTGQSPLSPGMSGASLLQNLKYGAITPQEPVQQQAPILPTYKTPKQLREELKRKKQEERLQKKFEQRQQQGKEKPLSKEEERLAEQQRLMQELTSLQEQQTPGVADAAKSMSTADFFKQLEELNKISGSVETDGEITDDRKAEIIEQLRRLQEGIYDQPEEKKKKRRGLFWIIFLSALLIGLIVAGIILYFRLVPDDYEYVRISVSMTNADDVFYETLTNGQKIPIKVNPGDSFPLTIIARNSKSILGDTDPAVWRPIYVRFRIWMIIDGVERPNYIVVQPNGNLWHRYNKDEEDQYLNNEGTAPLVSIDDGYYYYKGRLLANQQVELINQITFSLDDITENDGGKNAQINVQVEVLEDAYAINQFWVNAPHAWKLFIEGLES